MNSALFDVLLFAAIISAVMLGLLIVTQLSPMLNFNQAIALSGLWGLSTSGLITAWTRAQVRSEALKDKENQNATED